MPCEINAVVHCFIKKKLHLNYVDRYGDVCSNFFFVCMMGYGSSRYDIRIFSSINTKGNLLKLLVFPYSVLKIYPLNYQKPKKLVAPFDRGKSLGLLLFKKE